MTPSIERIVGPKADEAELRYIAALHQTCLGSTRPTGTISSIDIARSLKSRHSIEISHAQARDIVRGLGGGDIPDTLKRSVAESVAEKFQSEETVENYKKWRKVRTNNTDTKKSEEAVRALVEETLSPSILYLDLVQTTSILLIPTFARMALELHQRHQRSQLSNTVDPYTSEVERIHARLGNVQKSRENSYSSSVEVRLSAISSGLGTQWDDPEGAISEEQVQLESTPDGLLNLVLQSMWNVVKAKKLSHGAIDDPVFAAGGAPKVTYELVELLLTENGEMERVNDPDLIQQMVHMVMSPSGRFDEMALVNALTYDLREWDVSWESRKTSYIDDVIGHSEMENRKIIQTRESMGDVDTNEEESPQESANEQDDPLPSQLEFVNDVEQEDAPMQSERTNSITSQQNKADVEEPINSCSKVPMSMDEIVSLANKQAFSIIDSQIDTFGSWTSLVLTWSTFILHSATYSSLTLQAGGLSDFCTNDTFGCTLGKTILAWVVFALLLTIFGLLVLLPLSYGNHPTKRNPSRMFLAIILTLAVALTPILLVRWYERENIDQPVNAFDEMVVSRTFKLSTYATVCLGLALALNYTFHFLVGLGKQYCGAAKIATLAAFSTTSNVRGTARLKKAATHKINLMLTNARKMHGNAGDLSKKYDGTKTGALLYRNESDAVFQNYTLHGESREAFGSVVSVMMRLWTGELFDEEGIWLPSRLIVFQFVQIVVAILVVVFLVLVVDDAAKSADEATAKLEPDFPKWVIDFIPNGDEVRWALIPAATIAGSVPVVLILIYIPSTVKTVLKFRCGIISVLGDAAFHVARATPDTVYMNTSNAIYGTLAASGLFFVLLGLLLFLFVWEFTRDIGLLLLAWGIGLTITILLKMLMTSLCRQRFFRAFYRIHPGRANFSSLMLECWFIGLGGGVLVGRITQFLLAAAFWIGRIDEPFLAENVSLFGYQFDYVPSNYIKEILLHEAHRHPFLERLSSMYLMRLRHKENFGNQACACWRQLFVLTLMPWLMKHRVFHEQRSEESLKDQKGEREIEEDEDKDALRAVASDILFRGANMAGMVDQGAKTVGKAGMGVVDAGAAVVGKVGVGVVDAGIAFMK